MKRDDFIAFLELLGYTRSTGLTGLGYREFKVGPVEGKREGVTIGMGYLGDVDCYTVFFFDPQTGEFLHHGSMGP